MGLRDWLRRQRGDAEKQHLESGDVKDQRAELPTRVADAMERMRAAEEKGWWKDKTGFVNKTDHQLVVIQPLNSTPDNLRRLGQKIERWQAGYPRARYIWGLDDLLLGHYPRTPPIYLAVPYSLDRFEERYERVVLVFVAEGTNRKIAADDLYDQLSEFHNDIELMSPEEFSRRNR